MSVNVGKLIVGPSSAITAKGHEKGGVFPLRLSKSPVATVNLAKGNNELTETELWHQRYMHTSWDTIWKSRDAVTGMNLGSATAAQPFCEPCVLGKMHKLPHRPTIHKDNRLLGAVSFDLVLVPKNEISLGGAVGFLGFSVRSTGFKFGYAVKSRADVPRYVAFAREFLERQTGEKVKSWHMDQAGEHTSKLLKQACETLGIILEYTATDDHEQNGEIEGWFRVAFDSVRAHQIHTEAPRNLWADGLQYRCFTWNRILHGDQVKTPYELMFGRPPNVGDLRVLYCLAYVRVLPNNLPAGKLSPRAKKGRFIGTTVYDGQPVQTRGYKILLHDSDPKSVVISRDVYFVEDQFDVSNSKPLAHSVPITNWDTYHDDDDADDVHPGKTPVPNEGREEPGVQPVTEPQHSTRDEPQAPTSTEESGRHPTDKESGSTDEDEPSESSEESESEEEDVPANPANRLRSMGPVGSLSRTIGRYWGLAATEGGLEPKTMNGFQERTIMADDHGYAMLTLDGPRNVKKAMEEPRWKAAMEKEMNQLYEKNFGELVDRTPDMHVLIGPRHNEACGMQGKAGGRRQHAEGRH
jgi:hypothetical protein